MPLLKNAPTLDPQAAAALAAGLYGVRGNAAPLTSERDQNFLIESAGERFVLKVANAAEDRPILEAQNAAMAHVSARTGLCPRVIPTVHGDDIGMCTRQGIRHFVRLLTWLPGRPLGLVRHHSRELLQDLGRRIGEISRALADFDHPAIHREFHWDLAHGSRVVRDHAPEITDAALRARIDGWTSEIEAHLALLLPALRRSAAHNDANDYNVIVADEGEGDVRSRNQRVSGVIDFGDMVHSFTVADLAIAIAYAVLDKADPLAAATSIVRGYHAAYPLTEVEIAAVFDLVRLRLCASVAVAAHQQAQRPSDGYLGISQQPIARTLPVLSAIPRGLAEVAFRGACGLEPSPASARVTAWLSAQACSPPVAMEPAGCIVLDLSVGSPLVAGDPDANAEPELTSRIERAMKAAGATVALGRYGEPRLLYATSLFAHDEAGERRTVHLGLDFYAAAGTPVSAPLRGVVHAAWDNSAHLDYGPVVILEHQTDAGDTFYTLYGHLTRESLSEARVGRQVSAGEPFAAIGSAGVNGGWTPHLHFQVIGDLVGLGVDFPGVCRASQRAMWKALSQDPAAFLRLSGASFPESAFDEAASLSQRRTRIAGNISVGYRDPVKVVRGWMQHLYDQAGRQYLDAYNNVPHVGHSHPRVARAAADQLRVLNTNTRYLHDGLARFAGRLAGTLPNPLRICYFVSSGSEANELALRLARAHTRRRDLVVLESAYHGNTTTLIEISPYKFAGPGGEGRPSWVHVAPLPDDYRGEFKRQDPAAGAKYARQVSQVIERIGETAGAGLCGFIAESCPSVGGQIVPPPGYLAEVYASVRAAGGVCIADEVQTAYGRMGSHFYAFEAQGVVPDIVVLGKPIGNGYPLGAVVTTPEIAASFDNGMEFFSTFGGSTASCAVGLAVLDVVMEEELPRHAQLAGECLLDGLRPLVARHSLVGDVRGSGLFLGIELVSDRVTLAPATAEASFIADRMREEGILLGTEGPFHNVLKIRPPMPFQLTDADRLVETLDRVLGEIE